MYATHYQTDEQIKRENRRLQDEIDNYRYAAERQQEQCERAAEQRQRDYCERMQEQAREASDWPTAFRKNRILMERERNECYASADEEPRYIKDMDDLRAGWDRSLAVLDRAAAIWAEEQATIDEAIRLMRQRVAQRLRDAFPSSNQELPTYIEQDAIDEWMNW